MDDTTPWQQVNITFLDWCTAEQIAVTNIAPQFEAECVVGTWWFIRKAPCWRLRYRPVAPDAQTRVGRYLDTMAAEGHIADWGRVIYEPEVHAFGGPEAMAAAHRLFHADSRSTLNYIRDHPDGRHRREISLMLCSIMMRAAHLDLFEQGDIWARVANHRQPRPDTPDRPRPVGAVRRLITAAETQMRDDGPLAYCAEWSAAFEAVGRDLAALNDTGTLHRGLREILAHHVIFAWNRLGLSYETQSVLAATAKTAIFGPEPALAESA